VNVLLLLLLPLWVVLLVDGGLKLLLLAVRVWGRRANNIPGEQEATARYLTIGIVIAAHDEATVIGETVRRLRQLHYPADRYAVLVLADGCADDTAARARAHGARCVVRATHAERGKGRALSWLLTEQREALRAFDVLLVCDADSRLHPEALSFINTAFLHGCQAAQLRVRREMETTGVGSVVALPEALSQEVDDYARGRFGWSVPLRGTGMAFQRDLFMRVGARLRTKAEDLELSLLLAAEAVRVQRLPEAIVYDPKPVELTGATRQRARWLQGHWEVARCYWREAVKVFHAGSWGDRTLLFSLYCRPRTLVMGTKAFLAGGMLLWTLALPTWFVVTLSIGASVAFLADFLYYLVGFLLLSRIESHGGAWRMFLYLPIWIGAVTLSVFSTKKWLKARDRAVGR
jgi:cellulose synthase/poly-beta-1,6-N-acetylglucosamine synthase-like glycosyltransferase